MKALVVDDEHDRRSWMREGLLDHGVTSEEASTIESAIRLLHRASYDLVVCDMILTDPPEAANPALRGYLVVCVALALSNAVVIQASSLRRWVHAGAVLTNWKVEEVADVLYGARGIPAPACTDGGCPWSALQSAAATPRDLRRAAADQLAHLPIVRALESPLGLGAPLGLLEDAARGLGDWDAALAGFRDILFPGAGHEG